MKKVLFIALVPVWLQAQIPTSLGVPHIVELETVRSPLSQTLITASMQRTATGSRVVLQRSSDNGISWTAVDSVIPGPGDSEIPDPVLAVDTNGHFFLCVMRVNNAAPPFVTADLNLYGSSNDGLTWSYLGAPHSMDVIADYPQLLSGAGNQLFLVYSHLHQFPLTGNASLVFKKSGDGGVTWSPGLVFDTVGVSYIGADIARGPAGNLLVTTGDRKNNKVYAYLSPDLGQTWPLPQEFNIPNGEAAHIAKPVTNPLVSHFGILSHRPHQENTAIVYHTSSGPQSQVVDHGAYAQACMTSDGVVHLVYNRKSNNVFQLIHRVSTDSGLTFSPPLILHSGAYEESKLGEYQSFHLAGDGLFYLSFCDWADSSKAKILVFSPSISLPEAPKAKGLRVYPSPTRGAVTVEIPPSFPAQKISVISTEGRVVMEYPVAVGSNQMKMDLEVLKPGSYLIRLEEPRRYLLTTILKIR